MAYKHDHYRKPRSLDECWGYVEELLRERSEYVRQVRALKEQIADRNAYIGKLEAIPHVKRFLKLETDVDSLESLNLRLRHQNIRLKERNAQLGDGPPDPWREPVIEWLRLLDRDRFATKYCLRQALGMRYRANETVEVEHGRRLGLIMKSIGPGDWVECTYVKTPEGVQRGWKRRPMDSKRILAPGGKRVIKTRTHAPIPGRPKLKVVAGGAK